MIMNLLPIPILDGGHIMFFIIEGTWQAGTTQSTGHCAADRLCTSALLSFCLLSDISRLISRMISLR
jgi:Zn-dependent protease